MEQRGDAYANADVRVSLEGMLHNLALCLVMLFHPLVALDKMFYPYSFNGVTHLHLTITEIASKQGHNDVSKLTPTDIAIEVRAKTFYTYHLL
jgi:hypothetical protein